MYEISSLQGEGGGENCRQLKEGQQLGGLLLLVRDQLKLLGSLEGEIRHPV